MPNLSWPPDNDPRKAAYTICPKNVHDHLKKSLSELDRETKSVLGQTEDKFIGGLMSILSTGIVIDRNALPVLDGMIQEAAANELYNEKNKKPSAFNRELAAMANFITINQYKRE